MNQLVYMSVEFVKKILNIWIKAHIVLSEHLIGRQLKQQLIITRIPVKMIPPGRLRIILTFLAKSLPLPTLYLALQPFNLIHKPLINIFRPLIIKHMLLHLVPCLSQRPYLYVFVFELGHKSVDL